VLKSKLLATACHARYCGCLQDTLHVPRQKQAALHGARTNLPLCPGPLQPHFKGGVTAQGAADQEDEWEGSGSESCTTSSSSDTASVSEEADEDACERDKRIATTSRGRAHGGRGAPHAQRGTPSAGGRCAKRCQGGEDWEAQRHDLGVLCGAGAAAAGLAPPEGGEGPGAAAEGVRQGETAVKAAQRRLTLAARPAQLPCRDEEKSVRCALPSTLPSTHKGASW
jgi:hypothetical protein